MFFFNLESPDENYLRFPTFCSDFKLMYLEEFLFNFKKFAHKMHLLFEIHRLRTVLNHFPTQIASWFLIHLGTRGGGKLGREK